MSINRDEINDAVQKFLDEGGEVTRLRYADKKAQAKAARKAYHISRQSDNAHSREYLEREAEKESQLVFSKDDRMRE
jgi:adenine-specific DNA methylase